MVPAFVVEIVPVFAAVVIDTARTKIAVKAMNLSLVIALAPCALFMDWVDTTSVPPTSPLITGSNE